MGRKGVSIRKKAKEKISPAPGSIPASSGSKADNLPEVVPDKAKALPKVNKKR